MADIRNFRDAYEEVQEGDDVEPLSDVVLFLLAVVERLEHRITRLENELVDE